MPKTGPREAYSGSGFALPGWGGCDGRHQYQLAAGTIHLPQERIVHLGLIVAVLLQILFGDSGFCRNVPDVPGGTGLGDFNVAFVVHGKLLL